MGYYVYQNKTCDRCPCLGGEKCINSKCLRYGGWVTLNMSKLSDVPGGLDVVPELTYNSEPIGRPCLSPLDTLESGDTGSSLCPEYSDLCTTGDTVRDVLRNNAGRLRD